MFALTDYICSTNQHIWHITRRWILTDHSETYGREPYIRKRNNMFVTHLNPEPEMDVKTGEGQQLYRQGAL